MQPVFDNIKFLVGNRDILERAGSVQALAPFSNKVIDFFDHLSRKLLNSRMVKQHPDIAAYGFWIRRSSLEKIRQKYESDIHRIGRGIAFQIAPSNIPVQFAVSMTYALTAGNACVIRVSNKSFEQVNVICDAICAVLREYCPEMIPYICIIQYDHNNAVTQVLSDLCDVRMVWGGDNTIRAIREIPVSPRCVDIGFADRYSIAIIDADDYLTKDKVIVAKDFYTDTYYSDQNACSSTRLIIWTGDKIDNARDAFWSTLEDIVLEKYEMNAISSSEKLLNTAFLAANHPGIKEHKKDNLLVRVELPVLYEDIMDYKGNSGYFFEYCTDDMESIVPILKKECQTITYVGNMEEQLRKIIDKYGVKGVDRIVPMGHSMDLSFVWDGYDLLEVLSRRISAS